MEIIYYIFGGILFLFYIIIGFGLFCLMTFMRMFTGQIAKDDRDIFAHWYIIFIWPFKKEVKWK